MTTLSLSRFLAAERRTLRAEYPDATTEEIGYTLEVSRARWFADARSYDRGEHIPLGVFRSYAYHVGRADALRDFSAAGNIAELSRYAPFHAR